MCQELVKDWSGHTGDYTSSLHTEPGPGAKHGCRHNSGTSFGNDSRNDSRHHWRLEDTALDLTSASTARKPSQSPTMSQVCSAFTVVITPPAQAWSCSLSSFLLVTTGRWHPFRGHGGLTSPPQPILLLPARKLLLHSGYTGVTQG